MWWPRVDPGFETLATDPTPTYTHTSQINGTYMNSFLFNLILILLCTFPIVEFACSVRSVVLCITHYIWDPTTRIPSTALRFKTPFNPAEPTD